MSFPEWGYSYNALYVPLTSDWQCSLVPARDLQDVDRGWKLSYENRQKARKEREEQIEQDRRDFDRLFRVSTSRNGAPAHRDFSMYVAFISDHLRIARPADGEDLTRILRDAVRDGRLIPAIDRAWCGGRRVTRQYAPQSWPKRAPDPKPIVYGFRNGQYLPLNADGSFVDDSPYVPVRVAARSAASVRGSGASSGFDWLGAAEAAAGALLSGAPSDDGNGGDSILKSFCDRDGSDGGSLLGDAHPFEYVSDAMSDDVFEIAAKTNNPDYAAKMLGYDRDTFGDMIHAMKAENQLRGDDNVLWHDNGDVYFKGIKIDNMHSY
ncbi:hypothetical protein AWB75_02623 [Caballeronia catudaia]|uniref:Uncharacterized protein n=1 Tax=Caballeronia catudaia TaxID=1777136 RepID=A0A158AUI3_9BURK|nr:hypothetical protein [Caballeronia catudaia]SAK61415.1 hypothetical protein AWB75_02623 [Caballeronia catudaia]